MAWRTEGKDIVISGWENGIADAPEKGIADIRNINLISSPGEAMVGFATSAQNVPPVFNSASVTMVDSGDTITYTPGVTPLYNGCPITFGSTTGGVTAGTQYWVGSLSGSSFQVFTNIAHASTLVSISANTSNTFSTIQMGSVTDYAVDYVNKNVFKIDSNGRVWWLITGTSNWTFIGNTTLTNAHGNGIVVQGGAWLLVFRDTIIDYFALTDLTSNSGTVGQWTFGWQTGLNNPITATIHNARVAVDNNIYFTNGPNVGAVRTVAGKTFNPTDSTTYVFANNAITGGLPQTDIATCLGELGANLLIGGTTNRLYQWDKVATNTSYPIYLPEDYTAHIVTSNSTAYIFAGNRGRIYQSNGSSVDLLKKIPDHLAGVPDPYYTWGGAIYLKNQLYFGLTATTNNSGALTTHGGVWALDLVSGVLRGVNSLSYGGFGGSTQMIVPVVSTATPAGSGYYISWTNGNTFGVDVTSNSPYAGSEAKIDTDLIPIGKILNPRTPENIEFKLARALVSGESVTVYARAKLSDAFVQVGTTSTVGAISDGYPYNAGASEWLQLRAVPNSTASSPSYVPITELRIR